MLNKTVDRSSQYSVDCIGRFSLSTVDCRWRSEVEAQVMTRCGIQSTVAIAVLSAILYLRSVLSLLPRNVFEQKYKLRYLHDSFIDRNEIIDDEISRDYNSGLGKERILYVDDDVIVVDKPSSCSTAPGYRESDSLASRIASVFKIQRVDKMIAHRLDYSTSGLVIFARNVDALTDLHTQFRRRNKMYKRYSAIVKGYVSNFDGEIDLPLGKQPDSPPLCRVDVLNGKESTTSWTLCGRYDGRSHLHLRPHTGRSVQRRDASARLCRKR